jgi:carboxynorspermidine decarboxylase
MVIPTPYYFIDESKLLHNLEKIKRVRDISGAKSLLALKCFSMWSVFDLMKKYMDGTTSSSLYEARLGYETFGKETHAYCVGYSKQDVEDIRQYASKIIFNSVSQLKAYHSIVADLPIGLRINPVVSHSDYDLADPGRKFSRLGVIDKKEVESVLPLISGAMFHFNCDNEDFDDFSNMLDFIGNMYRDVLVKLKWVSLGGGVLFTESKYPFDMFCNKLKSFSSKFDIQIYIEPGEAAISHAAELVTTVVDIVHNEIDIAIVDASVEAHLLDRLIYNVESEFDRRNNGHNYYLIAGRSCLAGDIFGHCEIETPLKVGDTVRILDAAGYSMVKKTWFNGLQMPAIVVKRIGGSIDTVRKFGYEDYKYNLS